MAEVNQYLSAAAAQIGTSALAAIQTNPVIVSIVASALIAGNTASSDVSSIFANPTVIAIINSAAQSEILSAPTSTTQQTRTDTRSQRTLSGTRNPSASVTTGSSASGQSGGASIIHATTVWGVIGVAILGGIVVVL